MATKARQVDAALEYIKQGFRVFPVKLDKTPYTPHGLKDAVCTQAAVKDYWSRWPDAGVGLVTDGLVVLDFDVKAGGLESLKRLQADHQELPKTRTHRTGGGGLHLLYRNPNGTAIRNTTQLGGYPGVDVRANGGYIVVPPSPHKSGHCYEVLLDGEIAPAPEWLVTLCAVKRTTAPPTAPGATIVESTRNDTLARQAGAMRRRGMSATAIEAALVVVNAEQCNPPLSEAEVRRIAGSVARYAPTDLSRNEPHLPLTNLPTIVVTGRHMRDVTADCLEAMKAANNPPRLFERSAEPVRVERDEQGRPFVKPMSESAMRGFMDRAASFLATRPGQDGPTTSPVHPPLDVVRDVMSLPTRAFPPLTAITESPVIRASGTVLSIPGYDAESRLYYFPDASLKVPPVPDKPTDAEVKAAASLICEPLCDFPFESDASRANAMATLICPVVRPLVDGCVPLSLLDKPQAGTGASLLAEVIARIATGTPAAMMAPPESNEEWGKVITTILMHGDTILVIDNIEGALESTALAVLLTSRVWKGRVLGMSKDVRLPNILTPIGTGNNVRLKGDLPRRCIQVRMDAKTARPWMRDVKYRHPRLVEWVTGRRGDILSAILTVARAWVVAGRPEPTAIPNLGGYEAYARTLGGILEYIGVLGFLGNLESMYESVDASIPAWTAFFAAWREASGDKALTTAELVTELNKGGDLRQALPDDYADTSIKNYQRRLGIALGARKGQRFPNGLTLKQAGSHNRAAKWVVVESGNESSQPTNKQDSYQTSLKMSLNESCTTLTCRDSEEHIYRGGVVEDSLKLIPESGTYESCPETPVNLRADPCPTCGKCEPRYDDVGTLVCSRCFPLAGEKR